MPLCHGEISGHAAHKQSLIEHALQRLVRSADLLIRKLLLDPLINGHLVSATPKAGC